MSLNVLNRIGNKTYRLELPQDLHEIHNVFHVFYLRKGLGDKVDLLSLEEI